MYHTILYLKTEDAVTKPVHCLKLLSGSNASVLIRVFYDNGIGSNHSQEFLYDGNGDGTMVSVCKVLSDEMHEAKVVKVDIQATGASDAAWKSQGILIQDVPGGKTLFY